MKVKNQSGGITVNKPKIVVLGAGFGGLMAVTTF